MKKDLTKGHVIKTMLLFACPMILGNMLQQLYNVADTLIVGRALGADALAAVGSAYTLMTFLTSVLIGLCMGSGAAFSFYFGKGDMAKLKESMCISFAWIGAVTVLFNFLALWLLRPILRLLRIPQELFGMMEEYTQIIFFGICFVFLYNYFAYLLRAVGNSVVPLCFLGVSSVLNIILDLLFVITFQRGIAGAAEATVISQAVSGFGIAAYTWFWEPSLRSGLGEVRISREGVREILHFSLSASMQQSVMNFGILMVQGLINSFGAAVMAAFAAGVKIDTFAYMPAQEFGNAFSLFVSQNYGAGENDRVKRGTKGAALVSGGFCICISVIVCLFAERWMRIFVSWSDVEIIRIGAGYLRAEGAFYLGIGILFLFYGYYRGINKPGISLLLTVISLGTRVLLAYALAPAVGVIGIWIAIPIGWVLADVTGAALMRRITERRGSIETISQRSETN
ncbi:MAG: MATE family efflux transporter [Lachnospiraceae bacterium]|nr:MATE family efflux transporter [Lachnospiraceae bacterium]